MVDWRAVCRGGFPAVLAGLACWVILGLAHVTVPQPGDEPAEANAAVFHQASFQTPTDTPAAPNDEPPLDPFAADDLTPKPAAAPPFPADPETPLDPLMAAEPAEPLGPVIDALKSSVAELAAALQQAVEEERTWRETAPTAEQWTALVEQVDALSTAAKRLEPLEPALQELARELRVELEQVRAQVTQRPVVADLAEDEVTTKLYRITRYEADQLLPLIKPLLTPKLGLAAVGHEAGGDLTAVLVRDRPEVVGSVDRLIRELERPMLTAEVDVGLQTIDPVSGKPLSEPLPIAPSHIRRDGAATLVFDGALFPETTAAGCDGGVPAPLTSPPARLDNSPLRALRITPRVVIAPR